MVGYYISMVDMCKTFGWTPNQVREMNLEDLRMIKAVLIGIRKGERVGKT